jgi:hypothetical protein
MGLSPASSQIKEAKSNNINLGAPICTSIHENYIEMLAHSKVKKNA